MEAKPEVPEAVANIHRSELRIRPVEAAQTAPPTAEEKVLLDKVKDSPDLSDHQRKARDKKLRQAATAQRVANRRISTGGTAHV